jgi:hypothetical protein
VSVELADRAEVDLGHTYFNRSLFADLHLLLDDVVCREAGTSGEALNSNPWRSASPVRGCIRSTDLRQAIRAARSWLTLKYVELQSAASNLA